MDVGVRKSMFFKVINRGSSSYRVKYCFILDKTALISGGHILAFLKANIIVLGINVLAWKLSKSRRNEAVLYPNSK
jgi:hypothetical protein